MMTCSCEQKMECLEEYKRDGVWWTIYRCVVCDKYVRVQGTE